ncbi:FAD-dependent oxidoreductase [Gephyromycinifex aptenodytis]|uniref:FAD-dependent oxidoreductase n=1 Tax=Gephyromycinifex aptenodytis TaxID=2716227 RepID=UPI0014471645|nr:FAD-dependent oxidoreductase [Gephyromycinifex aptenodytis]
MRIIIVGGVAGGMSAATRLRRLMEDAEILVLERSGYVSFANCGLPYYVGGVIEKRASLLLQTPESLHARFRLDVRVRHEVTAIDTAAKTVTVRDLEAGTQSCESYDHLILSMGASPVIPPIPGIERALTLRDVGDVDRMAAATDQALAAGKSAVVIGGGFIGVEVAENLAERGLQVTLVELADQVLPPLDPELASFVADELLKNGVSLRLATQVSQIGQTSVTLSSQESIPADIVVASIGVRPETRLAEQAGITIGSRGGVVVDDSLRTSAPEVYAVGDMVEKLDPLSGAATLVPLANIANRQGRRVADVIAGREPAPGTAQAYGTAVVKVFGLTAASTGANAKRLRAQDRRFVAIHTHPVDHAGYYPGASQMHLTLLFDPDSGEILGAQGVGPAGVERRIDVIATAMAGKLGAADLIDLELAYAPPYGSAKDPINQLGYLAENVLTGEQVIQWDELGAREPAETNLLIDVRSPQEFAAGSIPGARNIPVDELRDRIDEIPPGPHTVFCQVGQRGHVATRLLGQLNRQVTNLTGGYLTWKAGQRARELSHCGQA